MNPPTAVPPASDFEEAVQVPADLTTTRPIYWSVRRELWENRSIYLAPLAVTAVVLFASLISMIGLPHRMQSLPELGAAERHALVVKPFSLAPAPIMLATILVGLFYALDALYGERRDRSILFWKSLPVSDRTTVLAKASVPLVVLPLVAFALSVFTVAVMLLLSTLVLVVNGIHPAVLWSEYRYIQEPLIMLYGLAVHALWFAPVYAWLLLVSVWARRTPVLWAALPPFAVFVVEKLAFNTAHFPAWLKYRVTGAMAEAFPISLESGGIESLDRLAQLTPGRFLSSSGLWLGLALAAVFLAAAVRLRRNREPI